MLDVEKITSELLDAIRLKLKNLLGSEDDEDSEQEYNAEDRFANFLTNEKTQDIPEQSVEKTKYIMLKPKISDKNVLQEMEAIKKSRELFEQREANIKAEQDKIKSQQASLNSAKQELGRKEALNSGTRERQN